MNAQAVIVVIILLFLIIALFNFVKIDSVSNIVKPEGKTKILLKYLPVTFGALILISTFTYTIYNKSVHQDKKDKYDSTIKKIDSIKVSANKKLYLKTATDTFTYSQAKVVSLKNKVDSNLHVIAGLTKYVRSTNAFKEDDSKFSQSVDSSYTALKKTADSLKKIIDQPDKHGFAYYGAFNGNIWTDKNFNLVQGGNFPKVGDNVKSLLPVNIRASVIKYDQHKGWINSDLVGAIKTGQTVRISEIDTVANNYIWIKF